MGNAEYMGWILFFQFLTLYLLFYILKRKFLILFSLILNYLTEEFFAALGRFKTPGLAHIFVSFFFVYLLYQFFRVISLHFYFIESFENNCKGCVAPMVGLYNLFNSIQYKFFFVAFSTPGHTRGINTFNGYY